VLNVVREALDNIVPPLAGQAFAKGGLPGLRQMLGRALLFAALTGTSAVMVLGLFGPWLLHRLYGGEILEFDWVIVWYAFAFPMALMTQALGCAFRALERTRPIFLAVLVGGCFNLLAVYPAAVTFGVAGLIAVTLLSELTVLIVLTILVARVPGMVSGEPHERTRSAGGRAVAVPLP